MGGGVHLGFDGTTFIVLGLIAVLVAGVFGYVSPQITQAGDSIANWKLADERARAKMQADNALQSAQADAVKAQNEALRAKSAADAQVAIADANARLVKAKSDGDAELARIVSDQKRTSETITGLIALSIGLLLFGCGYLAMRVISDVQFHRTERAKIEAHRALLSQAIDAGRTGGGVTVTLENQHSFTIHPMPTALPAPAQPALTPPPVAALPRDATADAEQSVAAMRAHMAAGEV